MTTKHPLLYTIHATPWVYSSGKSAWHFISIPSQISMEMKQIFSDGIRPFGSLPVQATIGSTTWHTSVFWNTKTLEYFLPLKKDVRIAEALDTSTSVTVQIQIVL